MTPVKVTFHQVIYGEHQESFYPVTYKIQYIFCLLD